MAATLTAGTYASPNVREVETGNFSVYFKYELNGVSLSVGDTLLMGYIPQNVTVIDGFVWGAWSSGAGTFDLGSQASISALQSAITCTAGGVNRGTTIIPRRFSLSADAEGNLRVPIAIKIIAGTSTVTGSLNVMLICTRSPQV